ncbi:MAG: oligosaccharide flippase family protein [Bacteroides sp.]|nr:oligosaccharide flippase family protein [Bacteroides sp.]
MEEKGMEEGESLLDREEKGRGENSYGNILKRIGAFGGVQVWNILLGLLRGKFVAILLGPAGMGVSSLYAGASGTMQQLAGLGLNLAMVKEVAASAPDSLRRRFVMQICQWLILLTSLLGLLICLLPAPLWSRFTFGDPLHTQGFFWLSAAVALTVAGNGYLALLQGAGEVKRLSKASVVGGLAGVLFGVPLYYFFGTAGIVPAMILLALSLFLFYYLSFRRSCSSGEKKQEKIALTRGRVMPLARLLVSTGLILMVGSLSGTLVSYLINLFVRSQGGVADVGLFQAANSLTNQYVGMIFSALALDYFPRLSAVCRDKDGMREVVNRQTEIVMLIAAPLLIMLIMTTPLVIRLLLSEEFMVVIPLMRWMGMGMAIQALAFPLGYIYVARDDRKAYLMLEIGWANVCWISCSVLFYWLYGLVGLGISLVARNIIDIFINVEVCRRRYSFRYSSGALRATLVSMALVATAFGASFLPSLPGYALMGLLTLLSGFYSFRTLRRRLRG